MTRGRRRSQPVELVPEGGFSEATFLAEKGFGEKAEGRRWLFPEEVLFLVEKGDLDAGMSPEEVRKFFSRKRKGFLQRYAVYRDLRTRGYVVRAGAKYGADFRVYEKGVKPTRGASREHSKFLVWVLGEHDSLEMKTLVGINRVAHSVKKSLVIAVVDKELDVTYIQNARVLL